MILRSFFIWMLVCVLTPLSGWAWPLQEWREQFEILQQNACAEGECNKVELLKSATDWVAMNLSSLDPQLLTVDEWQQLEHDWASSVSTIYSGLSVDEARDYCQRTFEFISRFAQPVSGHDPSQLIYAACDPRHAKTESDRYWFLEKTSAALLHILGLIESSGHEGVWYYKFSVGGFLCNEEIHVDQCKIGARLVAEALLDPNAQSTLTMEKVINNTDWIHIHNFLLDTYGKISRKKVDEVYPAIAYSAYLTFEQHYSPKTDFETERKYWQYEHLLSFNDALGGGWLPWGRKKLGLEVVDGKLKHIAAAALPSTVQAIPTSEPQSQQAQPQAQEPSGDEAAAEPGEAPTSDALWGVVALFLLAAIVGGAWLLRREEGKDKGPER